MGGAIAFTLTAATQLPFYSGGDITRLGVPLAIAAAAGAAGAVLAAGMILRSGRIPLEASTGDSPED